MNTGSVIPVLEDNVWGWRPMNTGSVVPVLEDNVSLGLTTHEHW